MTRIPFVELILVDGEGDTSGGGDGGGASAMGS
jgi:hypothetical protein